MPLAIITVEDDADGLGPFFHQVEVAYVEQVDQDYGADADGHRGTLLIERDIIETIAPDGTPAWVIESAEDRVMRGES